MRHPHLPAPDEFHVQSGADAVGDARRRVVRTVRQWNLPVSDSALADVEVCAGEIITNALTHAGDECWVRTHWTGQSLKVEVTDRSLRAPVACAASADDTGGRGLAMVECLAHAWGWTPGESGKTVYFVVAYEAALTDTPWLSALVRAAQGRMTRVHGTVLGIRRGHKSRTRGKVLRIVVHLPRRAPRRVGS